MSTSELPPPPSQLPAQANLHIFVARHVAHRQTAHVTAARHTSQKHVTSCKLHAAPPCASARHPPAIIQQNSGNKKPERARGRHTRQGSNAAYKSQIESRTTTQSSCKQSLQKHAFNAHATRVVSPSGPPPPSLPAKFCARARCSKAPALAEGEALHHYKQHHNHNHFHHHQHNNNNNNNNSSNNNNNNNNNSNNNSHSNNNNCTQQQQQQPADSAPPLIDARTAFNSPKSKSPLPSCNT